MRKLTIKLSCLLLISFWTCKGLWAQEQPFPLEVTWDKTTVLVFPGEVISIDRGSRALLAQKDEVAGNVLKLKGGVRYFPVTNLHVITDKGVLYQFEVRYADRPLKTTHHMLEAGRANLLLNNEHNKVSFHYAVHQIIGNKVKVEKRVNKYQMRMSLLGIYQQEGMIYFHLGLENNAPLPFEIKELTATIKDKKQVKRTSSQTTPLEHTYNYFENGKQVISQKPKVVILAFPQFTIADKKQLHLQLNEKHGDRTLTLKLKGKHVLKAKRLADVQL
ncbi:conjugative transposon protein TraN [Belliella kenyensis]|uniref:Conjugative transposon protein TraN n=1 Tax=Belliella kenyensis TaxID=1472724 RepID=A0ABV8ELQ5_9BACT|nr:conjugative transposon protein TraN [Belliella kenyensis]MCH7400858.1 conjugative transposon protein TraN [Belliella kenyensis]MDN3601855.1 conjugative transposon protein TraN [Belliella kenyensis]